MSPQRAAASVANALSFPRAAMRALVRGRWQVRKLRFDLDEEGRGEVLYRLEGAGWVFHFFLLSQKLPEEQKTDRNFAASWDAMGVLCQGAWTPEREEYLRQQVPLQRAGYADYDTLIYARGNRSARVFEHVVERLASGQQPDLALIAPVGYILRTTAFIGNGQLGTRPFAGYEPDHPLRRPYHAQFCSGFMLREYVFDLVDHLARVRSSRAVRMAPAWRRFLGLGNSAATGLSNFVANHPHFMHGWTRVHEEAIAIVRGSSVRPGDSRLGEFGRLLDKAIRHFEQGAKPGDGVFLPPQALAAELARLRPVLAECRSDRPWAALDAWARAHLCLEAREVLNALLLEVHPEVVERFDDAFFADERFILQPAMTAGELARLVDRDYAWALHPPEPGPQYFWYRTTAAPRDTRRGLRGQAPEFEAETTQDTPLQVRRLHEHLKSVPAATPVADITSARPDLRHIVARVQSLAGLEYAELRYDWTSCRFSPFPTVRLPLTFFGMEKMEAAPPKSVRGVFLQGAPIAEDVAAGRDGDWPFVLIPDAGEATRLDELAPMPVTTVPRQAAQVAPRRKLKIAPGELARMAQTALQGHGAALGVAEEAGRLLAFAQGCGLPAIAALLEYLERGGDSARLSAASALDQLLAHARATEPGATQLTAARAQWLREGLDIDAGEFAALAAAGTALLLPQAQEHRVLPPGADPHQTF